MSTAFAVGIIALPGLVMVLLKSAEIIHWGSAFEIPQSSGSGKAKGLRKKEMRRCIGD